MMPPSLSPIDRDPYRQVVGGSSSRRVFRNIFIHFDGHARRNSLIATRVCALHRGIDGANISCFTVIFMCNISAVVHKFLSWFYSPLTRRLEGHLNEVVSVLRCLHVLYV